MSALRAHALTTGCRLVSADGRTLPLKSTHLHADARAGLARVRVEQTFENPHDEPLRVRYQLPLPADGAVVDFAFRIGATRIQGEVHRKADARARFEQAVVEEANDEIAIGVAREEDHVADLEALAHLLLGRAEILQRQLLQRLLERGSPATDIHPGKTRSLFAKGLPAADHPPGFLLQEISEFRRIFKQLPKIQPQQKGGLRFDQFHSWYGGEPLPDQPHIALEIIQELIQPSIAALISRCHCDIGEGIVLVYR